MNTRATRAKKARRTRGTCGFCNAPLITGQMIALVPGTGWVHSPCAADRMRTQPRRTT